MLLIVKEAGRIIFKNQFKINPIVMVNIQIQTPHPRHESLLIILYHCWIANMITKRHNTQNESISSESNWVMGFWTMIVNNMNVNTMDAPTLISLHTTNHTNKPIQKKWIDVELFAVPFSTFIEWSLPTNYSWFIHGCQSTCFHRDSIRSFKNNAPSSL